jgi:hypothetical protein
LPRQDTIANTTVGHCLSFYVIRHRRGCRFTAAPLSTAFAPTCIRPGGTIISGDEFEKARH